jgi:hypothetical protein
MLKQSKHTSWISLLTLGHLQFDKLFGAWCLKFVVYNALSKLTHNSSKIKQYFTDLWPPNSSCLVDL